MCLQDVLALLKTEGFKGVPADRIRRAISAGYVARPSLDGGLRFNYEPSHVEQLRRYFANPPQVGRPRKDSPLANLAKQTADVKLGSAQ